MISSTKSRSNFEVIIKSSVLQIANKVYQNTHKIKTLEDYNGLQIEKFIKHQKKWWKEQNQDVLDDRVDISTLQIQDKA